MPRPLIGITTCDRSVYSDGEPSFGTPCDYVDAVRLAGGLPVLCPPGETRVDELLSIVRGVLVVGGGDVEPLRYGSRGHSTINGVNRERDDFEIALVRGSLERAIP